MSSILCFIEKFDTEYLNRFFSLEQFIDKKLILCVKEDIFNQVNNMYKNLASISKIIIYTNQEINQNYSSNISVSDTLLFDEISNAIVLENSNYKRYKFINLFNFDIQHLYKFSEYCLKNKIPKCHLYSLGTYTDLTINDELINYKNIHNNDRCFIIGNGPSLNKVDMQLLKDEITFGTNRGYLGCSEWGFDFTYWTIIDRLQIEENLQEWEDCKNISDKTKKFIPYEYKNLLNLKNSCPINFHYNLKRFPDFSFSTEDIYLGYTVVFTAMQIAVNMGIKEIYLLGLDHNYNLSDYNKDVWTNSDSNSPTHFNSKYTENGRNFVIPRLEKIEVAFDFANKELNKKGIKILNATPGTKLKSFDCIEYSKIFKEK